MSGCFTTRLCSTTEAAEITETCEPQALGNDLPTVTDRGVALQSDRHASRSEGGA